MSHQAPRICARLGAYLPCASHMAPMWLHLQDTVKSNISMGREVGTSPTDLVQVVTRGQIMQGMQICDLAAIISNKI